MAVLVPISGFASQQDFELGKEPTVIGRHPECEIQIDDISVSRRHAQILYTGGSFYLEDLDSRNGTFLNDQQVLQATKLYDESEIRISEAVFIFRLDSASQHPHRVQHPTTERPLGVNQSGSIQISDLESSNSRVMSRIDAPSHHSGVGNRVSAEKKLAALMKITHALSESVEKDGVLNRVLEFLFDLFIEADRGFIILKNAEGRLEPLAFKSRGAHVEENIRVSRTIVNQVMETKAAIISSDAATDDRFDMAQSVVDFRIRSIMCAPLINNQDEAIGIIQLDTLKQSVVFSDEDLETMVTVAMQASLAIQKADLFEDYKKTAGLKTDLALAHELQKRFLPQRAPDCPNYEFFSYYRPMQHVGGDYYDFLMLSPQELAILTADVVGHGIAAAMLMAKVSADSRFALATTDSAVTAVSKMNLGLSDLNIDRFVTLALGMLHLDTNRLTIVNAGHMPPIIRRADGSVHQLAIEQAGLPLGIVEDYPYESVEVQVNPGDVVVMYTDGINEAMNAAGEQLTTQAMIKEIEVSQAKTADAIGELICDMVGRHIKMEPPIDDMCLICLGRKP